MKSGIYGLVSLDLSPPSPSDCLRLFGTTGPAVQAPGFAFTARDPDPSAIDIDEREDGVDVLLGRLIDAPDHAKRLGLAPNTPAVQVAAAARAQWGADMPTQVMGEWLLVQWSRTSQRLTLTMADCLRDDCYYVVQGARVALAPSIATLAGLDWIDGKLDGDALMRSMSAAPLRTGLGDRTFVHGVRRLEHGASTVISRAGVELSHARSPVVPPVRHIAFDAAMGELDQLLRRIVREQIAGHRAIAVFLSGGLDSSLVAALVASEREPEQTVHLMCSASPPGSGIPDETPWAERVAQHLGLPLIHVTPPAHADVHAPTPRMLGMVEGPSGSPRHYLYEAFEDEAHKRGATLVMDGCYGEMTISNHGFRLAPPNWTPRAIARRVRDQVASMLARDHGEQDCFHVEPARAGLAALRTVASDGGSRRSAPHLLRNGDPHGFEFGWDKTGRNPTSSSLPSLRFGWPFRDRRLLNAVAALPAGFARHGGQPRAMIRALLRGRVPDEVAMRPDKMAFSPTFEILLRDHAEAARGRIPIQRESGAGQWIDLDWLDVRLRDLSAGREMPYDELMRVQGTAIAAHFLHMWSGQAVESK